MGEKKQEKKPTMIITRIDLGLSMTRPRFDVPVKYTLPVYGIAPADNNIVAAGVTLGRSPPPPACNTQVFLPPPTVLAVNVRDSSRRTA